MSDKNESGTQITAGKAAGGFFGAILVFLLILGGFAFVLQGPGGIRNTFTSWSANWGGDTHWLIVKYNMNGEVIRSWDMKGTISHEKSGDGIYFTTDHGIVHITGWFDYVQDPTDEARKIYLRQK